MARRGSNKILQQLGAKVTFQPAIPSWAEAMVDNYRRQQNIPPHITDKQIFDRIERSRGMETCDVEAEVRDLIEENPAP